MYVWQVPNRMKACLLVVNLLPCKSETDTVLVSSDVVIFPEDAKENGMNFCTSLGQSKFLFFTNFFWGILHHWKIIRASLDTALK